MIVAHALFLEFINPDTSALRRRLIAVELEELGYSVEQPTLYVPSVWGNQWLD